MRNHWFRYLIMKWGVKVGSFFFLTFVLFFCFTSYVLAYSYSSLGDITNKTTIQVNPDYLNAPLTIPVNSSYNLREVREVSILINNYSFSANTNYQLELVLTDQTLEYANTYAIYGLNGEICKSDASANLSSGYWIYVSFSCTQATDSITIELFNIRRSYLWDGNGIFSWERATLRSAPEALNSEPSSSEEIINNQNANTEAIINNQNNNFNSCRNSLNLFNPVNNNIFINAAANQVNTYTGNVGNYVAVDSGNYTISTRTTQNKYRVCLANTIPGTSLISCYNGVNKDNTSSTITINNSGYSYLFIYATNLSDIQVQKGSKATTFETYGEKVCTNRLDNITDSVDGLNDTLNDDDVGNATSEASDFFSDFSTDTFGLTSIITAPLNLIQSLTSSTCSTLHLPLPYLDNKYLDLPCMSNIYSSTFGTFFTMYQTITFGIIAYWVCVRIFNMVKDFKNPEHDEIEVVDL